jgi:pyruvate ferredoxin oxidoreductase alpha subunit
VSAGVSPPQGRMVLTGDEAAAYAVMLARARVIGCYPITPQTVIVERLADLVAGRDEVVFTNLESEHSMFGYVIAAARTGVRTFTATSSQGLLYAHEQLHRASRERVPLVAVNINRAVFAPWSLEPDLSDSMSQRDSGWIQLYCASAQEVLDSILCAYRIAETVLLPVMVCAEAFLLSHTSEVVEVPGQTAVDAFIPELRAPDDWVLDPGRPRIFSAVPERPNDYYAFQRNVAAAMDEARGVIECVSSEFAASFHREKVGALEIAGNSNADAALVAIGTIGDTARELLDDDDDLMVVRVHTHRPFPAAKLSAALARASSVSVIDRAAAFGGLGPLGADVRSLRLPRARAIVNYVCGLGGAEVTPETLRWALKETRSAGGARVADSGPVYVPEGV